MKRLRVAVVSDALYPWHKGGKEMRYLHLLNNLPDHEMDVAVYSMKWWDETPRPVITRFGSLTYIAICPRIPMYRGSRRSTVQALAFAVSTLRLLSRNFDVIEADHMPYLQLLPLRIVAWLKRVPLVITWHEVWGKDGWRSYIGRMGFAAALIERVCIQLPDTIVAVSSGTAEKLVTMGANRERIRVVPNALDLDHLLATVAQPTSPELLFVGRLIQHKHADLAIEATRMLGERGLDVHLGIVGVGPEESRLRAQVAKSNLESRVSFYSTIESQRDLWSLIRGSRVLLAPSIREGFGIVVAESLVLGTPVVCALHPENESSKLIGTETGSLVAPLDADALAVAAEFWLNDVSNRDDRSSMFLAENPDLTVGAMTSSYAQLLRNVA
ncbi:MAG TPA: glycosyltransferase family 4 protein [Acidimicrobiales bacterium]|nr:glycosyltransferase family 4 protein [Acidimicrobiales bacterium]